MSANNTTQFKTILVPVDKIDEIEKLLGNMQVEQEVEQEVDEVEQEQEQEAEQEEFAHYEVLKIVNHKVNNQGEFQYQVVWKGTRGEKSWVKEEDCNCESLIRAYLAKVCNIKTVYIICRVSTKEQASSTSFSLKAQESEIRRATTMLTAQSRVVVRAISKSAYTGIPQELIEIGSAARKGDTVIVWRVDRLSRNIEKYMSWLSDLNNRGVDIYSHTEQLWYSTNRVEFLQAILDAQKESVALGKRIRLALRAKIERGDAIGGTPYGKMLTKKLDEQGNTIRVVRSINTAEKQVIKMIKKLHLERTSPANIAAWLNRRGHTKRGRRWNATMVKSVTRTFK